MPPETHKNISYGSHPLQTLDITPLSHSPSSQLWVIYIHGGAWRDSRITSASFNTTASLLHSNPHISGLASLNHRLSPHPQFPSDENVARYPDHVNDVLAALEVLREKYGVERYVLVGHSSGAAIAMQSLPLGRGAVGAVGLAGLYDFVSLVEAGGEGYAEFVAGAFGSDRKVWRDVSPVSLRYEDWKEGRWVVLGHSHGDELVGWEQVEKMEARLEQCGFSKEGVGRGFEVLELKGRHDQIWEEGREAAEAIELCIRRLVATPEHGV